MTYDPHDFAKPRALCEGTQMSAAKMVQMVREQNIVARNVLGGLRKYQPTLWPKKVTAFPKALKWG